MIIGVALDEDDPKIVVAAEVGDALVDVFGMEEVIADPEEDQRSAHSQSVGRVSEARVRATLTRGRALRLWHRLGNRI